jgi:hypothetical protein
MPHGGPLSCKGTEIKDYMWNFVKSGGRDQYVIFDDMLDFLIEQDEHLVRIDAKKGICDWDIDWADEIFEKLGEPKWVEDQVKSKYIVIPSEDKEQLSPEEREQLSFPAFGDEDSATKNWPIRGRLNAAL